MALSDIRNRDTRVDEIITKKEEFSIEKVLKQLENPDTIELDKEARMTWVEKLEKPFFPPVETERIYKAHPIMAALYFKRYDLVKKLLDKGFSLLHKSRIDDIYLGEMGYGIFLDQFIMVDPEMPDELRILLQKTMEEEKSEEKSEEKAVHFWHRISNLDVIVRYFFGGWKEEENNDFTDESMENLVSENKKNLEEYEDTVIRTMKLLCENIPQFADYLPISEWRRMDDRQDVTFKLKLIKNVYEEITLTNKQKIDLLKRFANSFYSSLFEDWRKLPTLFLNLEKYCKSDVDLEREFLNELILCCWDIEHRYGIDDGIIREIKKLIKERIPSDFSFQDFVNIFFQGEGTLLGYVTLSDLCKLYKEVFGLPICVNDQILEMKNRENELHIDGQDYKWLEYITTFSFDEEKPLNLLQRNLLRQKSKDVLICALRKGLFKGKQWNKAMKFCLNHDGAKNKIPCVMAFMEEK